MRKAQQGYSACRLSGQPANCVEGDSIPTVLGTGMPKINSLGQMRLQEGIM